MQGSRTRAAILVLLAAAVSLNSGCSSSVPMPPAFSGGIRVHALLGVGTGDSIALPPIPGVPNRGRFIHSLGFGNGTRTSWNDGITDAFGISDYPDAVTNAQWSIGIGPSATPPCLANAFMENVPLKGMEFFYFCHA